MCSKHMALKVKELQAQIRTARDDVYVEAPGQGHPWLTGASVDEMACLLAWHAMIEKRVGRPQHTPANLHSRNGVSLLRVILFSCWC